MVRGRGSNGEGEGKQWSSIQRRWICGSTHAPSIIPSSSSTLTPSLCLYPHTFPLSSTSHLPSVIHPHTFPLSLPSHLPSIIHPHTFPLSSTLTPSLCHPPSHLPSISPSHLPFMYNTNPSTSCDLAYDLAIVIVQLSVIHHVISKCVM